MKLTKYGFHLDLLKFSKILSLLGIIVSIIGILGGFVLFFDGSDEHPGTPRDMFYVMGGVNIILMIPYIIMWSLLEVKTSKQDIPGMVYGP